MTTNSPMPQVSAWANELREVFGAAEMLEAMKTHGYYAREGDVVAGRPFDEGLGIALDQMVIDRPAAPAPLIARRGGRGR